MSLRDCGIASFSTRYTLKPEEQDGNWLLERSTATFADGRTVATADAYFEIDSEDGAKYLTARTGKEEQDRGATIVVESKLPEPPVAAEPIIAAGAVIRPPQADRKVPLIDWTAAAKLGNGSIEETEERKKTRAKQSWLSEFLYASRDDRDLSGRTGLKVILQTNRTGDA